MAILLSKAVISLGLKTDYNLVIPPFPACIVFPHLFLSANSRKRSTIFVLLLCVFV